DKVREIHGTVLAEADTYPVYAFVEWHNERESYYLTELFTYVKVKVNDRKWFDSAYRNIRVTLPTFDSLDHPDPLLAKTDLSPLIARRSPEVVNPSLPGHSRTQMLEWRGDAPESARLWL